MWGRRADRVQNAAGLRSGPVAYCALCWGNCTTKAERPWNGLRGSNGPPNGTLWAGKALRLEGLLSLEGETTAPSWSRG